MSCLKMKLFFSLLLVISACSKSSTPSVPAEPAVTPATARLKNFAIYYGWPSSLNSATLGWSNAAVATFLKQYSFVVFGAGLEDPVHGDHANTIAITAAMKGTTEVYGYVGVGITNSYSLAVIQGKIDSWKNNVDVAGIFLDEFGFDFKLAGYTDADMRVRQKAVVDYVHAAGLKVFVNSFDPDDVFSKESSNPITWVSGDKYLYELYIFSSATRETFAAYRAKVAKLKSAMAQTGVEMHAINTTTALNSAFVQADFNFMILSAIADGFQGIGWGTENFSAASAVMPYRTNTSLFADYQVDPNPIVDNSAGTVSFQHTSGSVQLTYSNTTATVQ